MDFAWTQEQQRRRREVVEFARAHLNENLLERDRDGTFNHDGWRRCGAFGIQGLPVPEALGGQGCDALTTVGVLEQLGYGCLDNGLIFSICAHLWTNVIPMLDFGTEDQKRRYLPRLCSGELIGGNAMTEPEAGSDAFSLTTTAERKGDRYVLNGCKSFVSSGAIADVVTAFATIDPALGPKGITAFVVEKDFPGFVMKRRMQKMGLNTSPTAEIVFENCEVPAANRLGEEGAGMNVFTHSMTWERASILAPAVGTMQRLLEDSIRHARTRKQFGQAIGKFQLVAARIVDMKLRLENARQMLYRTAWLRDQKKQIYLEGAMTKLHISESWIRTAEDALQILGGRGYLVEHHVERELRDAIGSRLYSGTSEIQQVLIARLLGL